MLNQKLLDSLLEHCLNQGADFAEIFMEESDTSSLEFLDKKMHKISTGTLRGLGLRLLFGTQACYGYTNRLEEPSLRQLANNLLKAFPKNKPQGQTKKRSNPAGSGFDLIVRTSSIGDVEDWNEIPFMNQERDRS